MAGTKPTDHSQRLRDCKAQLKTDENSCDKEFPTTNDEGKRHNGICHGAAHDAFTKCVRKTLGAAALATGTEAGTVAGGGVVVE